MTRSRKAEFGSRNDLKAEGGVQHGRMMVTKKKHGAESKAHGVKGFRQGEWDLKKMHLGPSSLLSPLT